MVEDSLPHHLRFHHHHKGNLIGSHWSERLVEFVAEGIGTVQFLIITLALIVGWIILNGGYAFFSGAIVAIENGKHWDPAPWILLNLIFSFEAFFTGSLVVIAAKAQAKRERVSEQAAAAHRQEEFDRLAKLIGSDAEITAAVRDITISLQKLTTEVHKTVCPA